MTKTAIRRLKVENLAPNQTIIYAEGNEVLQSYNSLVAIKYADGKKELGMDWDYTRTTMKYVGRFLNCNAIEIRENIKSGKWKLNKNL